jgi:acyl transferase domain-containing protein
MLILLLGFGGTNAHAILESYEPPAKASAHISQQLPRSLTPFTFSATSQKSLTAVVTSYLSYLKAKDSIDLRSLAFTLNSRRSALPVKVAFSATTLEQLCDKMEGRLRETETNPDLLLGASSSLGSSSILGVLTGQGAQWAGMGSKLLASFKAARQVIEELDQSLATLPEHDRPQWTIMKELQSDSASSRIGEAAVVQPLSTAVQILLVSLLRQAGIQFKAIVGHSSGETAAAYAAGFISASDAIRIAYYRGLHAKLASGPRGIRGAMMAVGTSYEDAKEFCKLEDFNGRLVVAASNSPASVTLSGDADAIDEAKLVFDEEKKFARVLNIDKAYHSHHVLPCSRVFTESLQACDIQVHRALKDAPIWFSTVHGGKRMQAGDHLKALYWADNMENTVLFSQALEAAIEEFGPFNMGLEIGPHPALKGPVTQTIQAIKGKTIPYSGTLSRGKDDVESFSDALGSVWTHSGSTAVNFAKFVESCCGDNGPVSLLKGLPTYSWNHDRVFWSESRMAKLFRTQDDSVHELLGLRSPDGTDEALRWQNVLKPKEIPWLSCHALQGQTVFPGTGYIALAMEASIKIADGRPVQCIQLCDLQILKAIAIDDVVGTEILVTMTNIAYERQDSKLICAEFKSYSPQSKDSGKMVINSRCKVLIYLGEPSADLLPSRSPPTFGMSEVNIDSFYASMADLGYGYAGPFKGMSTLRRKFGASSGTIARPPVDVEEPLLFHPGLLDVSLQAMYAAFSAPGDGSLWSIHAPTGIRRVTLIPSLCGKNMPEEVSFDCVVTGHTRNNICGDVDIFTLDGKYKVIEIEGVSFVPFRAATQADDRCLFAEATWAVDSPDGDLVLGGRRATLEDYRKAYDCERIGFYYMRKLNDLFGGKESAGIELQSHHEALLEYASHINQLVLQGKHQYAKKEWITDTHEQICAIMDG